MGNFKIGVMADSFRGDFRSNIEKSAAVGGEGVQIYATYGDFSADKLNDRQIAQCLDIVKSNGLVVSALCGDFEGHGFERPEDNKWKIEKSKRVVDLALKMETNIVTTHIGVLPADSGCDRYKIMQEACNALAEYAHSQGAFFAIETGPEKAVTLKGFLDSLTTKGVAVNLDPANLVMVTGDDPVQAVYTLKDYIVHTHAKDGRKIADIDPVVLYGFFAEGGIGDLRLNDYFQELPLGKGGVDFDSYLQALQEIGYHGFLTIEREVGENPAADIGMAVDFLRSKIG